MTSVLLTVAAATLCAQTPRQSMIDVSGAARLVAFQGQISVLRGTEPWALNVGDYVQPGQVIVTGADGTGMFKVGDGSTFEIFAKSKVVFRANRGDWQDLLEIMLGKIKVQIEHPGGLPNNNKIRTPTAVISVRGTTFDVDYDEEKELTTVFDEEGSVEVARSSRLDDKRILNANQSVEVYKNSPLAKASFDKGGWLKRVIQSAVDAATQQAINSRSNPGSAPTAPGTSVPASTTSSTSVGDKNNSPAPTPPAPPPPPAP